MKIVYISRHYCRLIVVIIMIIILIIITISIIIIILTIAVINIIIIAYRDTYTCGHHKKLKETISAVNLELFYRIRRNEMKYFYKYDLNKSTYTYLQ